MIPRTPKLAFGLAIAILAGIVPAHAGTVSVAWDPVADADLAGYRVYYGAASGSYTQSVDVGNVTSTTLNLADCQVWYVATKAYDTAGNMSASYSNEVSGWARPIVSAVNPSSAEQGRTLSVVISGSNFQNGATVAFANAGVTVTSVTVNSCTQLTATIAIASTAAAGATSVEVTNPDQVFGTGVGVFTVQAAVAPTVQSTTPADGATGVSIGVKPTVTFSEPMLASSITATTVRLLDDAGAPVAQAAGSPSLSADGVTATINPASALGEGRTYKIQVVGGASGVRDVANNPMASTYTHATGFRTVADTTAPTISAVASSNVGSTSARITWTTDEAADSQVFYRPTGTTAYQSTDVDAALVTSHQVDLQGLTPSTAYEYYVRSADSAGNAGTSSNSSFTTTASTSTFLRFESEAGVLTAPVRSQSGAGSFSGSYIDTPAGTSTGSASAPAGTAVFGVNVPTAGTWYLWVRVYAPNANSDTWFESVDGGSRQTLTATRNGAWHWVQGRSYTLTAGLHSVELGGREAQTRADRVLLTNDATFVPTEQAVGDQTPPAPVTSLAGTPADRQVRLDWQNPSADYLKTVVRYRTDGKFPVSPVDGFAVTERNGTAGATDTFTHASLTNGTTYHYAAFAIDAAGNASVAATTTATPIDNQPPGAVINLRRMDKKTN